VLHFAGGFAKNRVQYVVFLWSICGEMLVNDGELTASFLVGKIRHGFGIYFCGVLLLGMEIPRGRVRRGDDAP
jgi:hypothetical protein